MPNVSIYQRLKRERIQEGTTKNSVVQQLCLNKMLSITTKD